MVRPGYQNDCNCFTPGMLNGTLPSRAYNSNSLSLPFDARKSTPISLPSGEHPSTSAKVAETPGTLRSTLTSDKSMVGQPQPHCPTTCKASSCGRNDEAN